MADLRALSEQSTRTTGAWQLVLCLLLGAVAPVLAQTAGTSPQQLAEFASGTGLRELAERSFAVLRKASEALCARLPAEKKPPALMMSLHLWALSHGIASLFGRGDEGRRSLPMTPEELLEAGVLIYLRGLGVLAAPLEPKR